MNEDDYLRPDALCRELIDTIKNLDARLDELQMMVKSSPYKDDRRKTVVKRIEKLIDTRFKIVFTLMDVVADNKMNATSVFGRIGLNYRNLKRPIMTGKDPES